MIYHVANKRRMEKVPLSGSKLPPSGNNGLGRAGFRRKNFRYSNSPTYIDFEANCPLNCKSTIDCSIYTLWSGNVYFHKKITVYFNLAVHLSSKDRILSSMSHGLWPSTLVQITVHFDSRQFTLLTGHFDSRPSIFKQIVHLRRTPELNNRPL